MPSLITRVLSWPVVRVRRVAARIGARLSEGFAWVAFGVALLRSPWQITRQWPAQRPVFSGIVAIYAHHDPRGQVADYVLTYLAGLRDAGCQILFVSNAGALEEKAFNALESLCSAILVRKSWGGKWGAWREALHYLGEDAPLSLLVLADDSAYGPLFPLAPLLSAVDFDALEIWGLTESWQYRWHLQSYFLAIHPRVLRNPAWAKFWSGCVPTRSRRLLFRRGEVGFSQSMLRAGITLRPQFTHGQLCELVDRTPLESPEPEALHPKFRHIQLRRIDSFVASHMPFDPTQQLWRQLLKSGSPFFSRQLILFNPDAVQDLFDWNDLIEELSRYDLELIDKDLAAASRVYRRNWLGPLKRVYRAVRATYRHLRGNLSLLRSLVRSHRQARFVWPDAQVECGPRVLVFVHYDKDGLVRPHVLLYLQALRDVDVSIVFVSNSGKLDPQGIEALKPLCIGIIVRGNFGYDFGGWREGLEYLKGSLDNLEWLAIANDSVYGPLTPLGPLLARMDFTKADVWGFTDSDQRLWHLQSYFLAFSRRVLRSKAWHDFWRGIHPVKSKAWAISNGELRITLAMQNAGFDCAALFPYQDLVTHIDPVRRIANRGASPFIRLRLRHRHNLTLAIEGGHALNPTAELWRQLLRQGYPFLKRELLGLNPTGVPDSLDWQTEVAATSGADVRVIEEDLRRSVRGRVA